jgi:hypothetical protein
VAFDIRHICYCVSSEDAGDNRFLLLFECMILDQSTASAVIAVYSLSIAEHAFLVRNRNGLSQSTPLGERLGCTEARMMELDPTIQHGRSLVWPFAYLLPTTAKKASNI